MAKYTLLEMVQNILSSMESDEVNTYSETTESLQVAYAIRTTYNDLMAKWDLDEHKELFELLPTSATTPPVMTLPADVANLEWFKYDDTLTGATKRTFAEPKYTDFKQFYDYVQNFNEAETELELYTLTLGSETFYFKCYNDRAPRYYTLLKDNYVICDAYNSAEDSYLVGNKSQGYGIVVPTFTLNDSFTPSLDDKQFSMLYNEAKRLCFNELRQQDHLLAARQARQMSIKTRKDKSKGPIKDYDRVPNFGRK